MVVSEIGVYGFWWIFRSMVHKEHLSKIIHMVKSYEERITGGEQQEGMDFALA
jgi:hypothetical protein